MSFLNPSVRHPLVETALFVLFLALLVWSPVPTGSFFADGAALLQIGAYALFLAWLLLWALGWVRPGPALRNAALPLGLFALHIVVQAFYVLPLPPSVGQVLSPEAARMHALAQPFGGTTTITLSVDPYASKVALLKTLAYGCVFFLTLALATSRERIRWLAGTLVFAALAHAVYAVLMHLAGTPPFRWFGAMVSPGSAASGFFWNRNHFAGYLEMTLALGIGLLIAGLSDRRADSWKQFARRTLEWIIGPKMVLRLALCVLVIALTTTHSRMGNIAFFSSLLVAGVIAIVLSRHATRNALLLIASLVVIDLVIVGSWFGVERLVQRLEETTTQEFVARETPAAHTIAMLERSPVFGLGPGTFYISFEPYRPEKVIDYYNYAHNDYAQFAAESGLLGLALLGLFVVVILVAAIRAQWVRRDPLMRGMSFACMMGVSAILIHSTADFNLQIPSNAAYFMVVLALGWIALHGQRGHPREDT